MFVATLLVMPHTASSEPFTSSQTLDQHMIAEVTGAALAFMAPRTLESFPTAQLTLWSLRGLTTLDPRLVAELTPQRLQLTMSGRVLLAVPPPAADNSAAWGAAAAQLARVAWDASDQVRRAGTQGVLRNFFDELFNHLDPYSRYASPQEAAEEENRRNGRAGVGLDIASTAGGFTIRAVSAGGPAALAGIRPGDQLLAVDSLVLVGADLAAAEALLAGPEATEVSLRLRSPQRSVRNILLTRVIVTPPTVFTQRAGELLVIRISSFSRETASVIAQDLTQAFNLPRPPKGVVIDLRGNRGGLLRQAVDVASSLLTPLPGVKMRIASTVGRDPASVHDYDAEGVDLTHGQPVVIIVDGRTASAAEILAAALSDQRRAVVIGSATLGKGLVQTILPLPDGGAMSLTWSRVLAPLGWPLQALGVLPQVCTSMGEDALKRSLGDLAGGRLQMARALGRERMARAPIPPAEILEIRNACPASEGRESDIATAKFLIGSPQAYASALIPTSLMP